MRDRFVAYVIEEPSGHTRAMVRGRTAGEAAVAAHRRADRYRECDPSAWFRVTVGHTSYDDE